MQYLLLLSLIVIGLGVNAKDTYVNGYYRSNGTYVAPHYRSSPNSSTWDNYSTRGNTNPYTGQRGSTDPYKYNSGSSYRSNYSYGGYGDDYDDDY